MQTHAAWLALLVALGCGDDATAPLSDAGADATSRIDSGPRPLPAPPMAEPGLHAVAITDTRRVIPSGGLPAEAPPLNSNNNLDVIRHEGRVYLAWRTSPDHFAGPETVIHVVSSDDETEWAFEASYAIGTDLREPRFLSLNGSLFLYVSVLGIDRIRFEPMGVQLAERRVDGSWTELEDLLMPGYLVWRTRTERGTPYMLRYLGGEHIYRFDGIPLDIELLTTVDGRDWTAVNAARPVISRGGGSETDFTIGDDGTLFGIIRNEAGDETGWGSKVCRAEATDITDWDCRTDPKKYDSPLMFWFDGEAYLVGRRHLTETGHYDLMTTEGDMALMTYENQIGYINAPKRCSLWRWVQDEHRIAYVLDLPSKGDTCFPAWIAGAETDEIVLYNYSSDIDGEEVSWAEGQNGPTFIYRHVLRFTRR